jgi:uncharacterized protein (TIGR03437 family)
LAIVSAVVIAGQASGATFGQVVSIGGEGADLVLDEARGKLYIANFTANRIDVMSLATRTIQTSINVPAQPSSVALSPDGHWLLVSHYGNNTAPASPQNGLTVIDLNNQNAKQTFALGNAPLGVAFGIDNKALVVTTGEFIIFDPTVGTTATLATITQAAAQAIPVPAVNFPPNITGATVASSADYTAIYGLGDDLRFYYDVTHHALFPRLYVSSPPQAPRAVSVATDGSYAAVGWILVDRSLHDNAEFPNPSGVLNLGGHVVDSANGLIYSEVPSAKNVLPVLTVYDADNLTVRGSIQIPEDLAGKGVITADSSTLYMLSNSGVTVFPVGLLNKVPRVQASVEDLLFLGNYCERGATTQTITITDPGGNHTPFSIASSDPGVTVSPASGVTPATVQVRVDPTAFVTQNGTVTVTLSLASSVAVNIPNGVRVLINSPQPNQRGSIVDLPGTLVDLLADNTRTRFYVLRQDKNLVEVFNGVNNTQIATLRTCTKPTGMAQTFDGTTLLVACDRAHIMNVFDLDALQQRFVVDTGSGYGQSVAVSNGKILAVMRDGAGGQPFIAAVDLTLRTAPKLATLGVYQNQVPLDTVLAASPNGSNILMASSDGHLMLYDANVDSFTVSRQDVLALGGAYGASAFNQYVVGQYLLDSSLVTIGSFETATGSTSGFAFLNNAGYRTTTPTATSPGVIAKVDLATGVSVQPTPMVEAPALGFAAFIPKPGTSCSTITDAKSGTSTQTCTTGAVTTTTVCTTVTSGSTTTNNCATSTGSAGPIAGGGGNGLPGSAFTRSLAMLQDGSAFLSLSTSGLVVLPPGYAASVPPPVISAVVSAADGKSPAAPGGLVTLFGSNLNPVNLATKQIPIPTALGRSCVTVNGQPMPLIFVSPQQVNAQMPFQAVGNVVVQVHTPGGVSDNFNLTVPANSPAVFLSGVAGPATNIPTVFRADNGLLVTDSDPVHRGDMLVIFLTGMGAVTPVVGNGLPAPLDPLATALAFPSITLGGASLTVVYAGLAPGEVGVYQINAIVPPSAPQGLSVPLVIDQGGPTHTINLRVVQ